MANITKYRLMLYILVLISVVAFLYSIFGILPFSGWSLVFSVLMIVTVAVLTNKMLARLFGASVNVESAYITALILFLIITPADSLTGAAWLLAATILAIASKYLLTINRQHLFNPAAAGVVLTFGLFQHAASWWVMTPVMLPLIIGGGWLIGRKLGVTKLIVTFLSVVLLAGTVIISWRGLAPLPFLWPIISHSPLLFLGLFMLTEPLTTPPQRYQTAYGGLIGLLYTITFIPGSSIIAPELALVIGNFCSYIVSPKQQLVLALKRAVQLAPSIKEFVFDLPRPFSYLPGQYLEWTLTHRHPDNRGNRRYFTLASAPTENSLRLATKFAPRSSSFKQALRQLKSKDTITAARLAGSFVLPSPPLGKFVGIAGGIGITPFRSMIKYLLDTKQPCDLILLYSVREAADLVYRDIIERAKPLGIRAKYLLTDTEHVPADWPGETGIMTAARLKKMIPDYRERTFYLSGPHSMVNAFIDILSELAIKPQQIKTDFFPGYA